MQMLAQASLDPRPRVISTLQVTFALERHAEMRTGNGTAMTITALRIGSGSA